MHQTMMDAQVLRLLAFHLRCPPSPPEFPHIWLVWAPGPAEHARIPTSCQFDLVIISWLGNLSNLMKQNARKGIPSLDPQRQLAQTRRSAQETWEDPLP